MGVYDLPANIDFILDKTMVDKIDYVGHSQGTTQFWVANMMRDDIGKKIDTFIGMAPVLFTGNQTSIMATLGIKLGWDTWLEEHLWSILWLKQGTSLFNDLVYRFSPSFLTLVPRTTWSFVQGIVGFDDKSHMDTQRMPMMARNDVGGTSTQNLKHWAQNLKSGKFQTLETNAQPAKDYDLSKLSQNLADTNLLLFVGGKDALTTKEDFQILEGLLPDGNMVYNIVDYNHLDYMWAEDAS